MGEETTAPKNKWLRQLARPVVWWPVGMVAAGLLVGVKSGYDLMPIAVFGATVGLIGGYLFEHRGRKHPIGGRSRHEVTIMMVIYFAFIVLMVFFARFILSMNR